MAKRKVAAYRPAETRGYNIDRCYASPIKFKDLNPFEPLELLEPFKRLDIINSLLSIFGPDEMYPNNSRFLIINKFYILQSGKKSASDS